MLHRVGEVRLTGAYAYGVMLDPDIDVDVVVPAGRERSAAVALLQALIDQSYWNGYLFYDHREKRSPRPQHAEVPRVYYVGVKAHWWDVDIWVGDAAALPPQDDWVRRGMDERAREIVLGLKQARTAGHIRASGLSIYTAVLKHQSRLSNSSLPGRMSDHLPSPRGRPHKRVARAGPMPDLAQVTAATRPRSSFRTSITSVRSPAL